MIINSSNLISFFEPPYVYGFPSLYYAKGHRQFQKACRAFLYKHLIPHALKWKREELIPAHIFKIFIKHHILLLNLPSSLPIIWLKKLGIHNILGVKIE